MARHSSPGGRGGGGFSAHLPALDSISSKLGSTGDQLHRHSASVGSSHPGSGAFGVVGQAFAGRTNQLLTSMQQHVGGVAGGAKGASSKMKQTAQDLRNTEGHNSGLFKTINAPSGNRPAGGGSNAPSGGGGSNRPSGSGGGSTRPSGGGAGYNPPSGSGGGGYNRYQPYPTGRPPKPKRKPKIKPPPNPNIPVDVHGHVIYGGYSATKPNPLTGGTGAPTGGHVLGPDLAGTPLPPSLNSNDFGSGINPGGASRPLEPNGVYDSLNPSIDFPGRPAQGKPEGVTTMFPQGVPATAVQQMGDQAWNQGKPSGGFNQTKWSGTAIIPPYDYPSAPYPNWAGEQVKIEGYYSGKTGEVKTYFPSSTQ